MNEPRRIWRHCATCGEGMDIKLSGKEHWWKPREILGGGYFFFGDIKLGRLCGRWNWSTRYLGFEKSKSRIHQFLSDHIWWWSIPEQKCSVPNWKKPYYMLRGWIEERLDPAETAEYWECPDCYNDSGEDDVSSAEADSKGPAGQVG